MKVSTAYITTTLLGFFSLSAGVLAAPTNSLHEFISRDDIATGPASHFYNAGLSTPLETTHIFKEDDADTTALFKRVLGDGKQKDYGRLETDDPPPVDELVTYRELLRSIPRLPNADRYINQLIKVLFQYAEVSGSDVKALRKMFAKLTVEQFRPPFTPAGIPSLSPHMMERIVRVAKVDYFIFYWNNVCQQGFDLPDEIASDLTEVLTGVTNDLAGYIKVVDANDELYPGRLTKRQLELDSELIENMAGLTIPAGTPTLARDNAIHAWKEFLIKLNRSFGKNKKLVPKLGKELREKEKVGAVALSQVILSHWASMIPYLDEIIDPPTMAELRHLRMQAHEKSVSAWKKYTGKVWLQSE